MAVRTSLERSERSRFASRSTALMSASSMRICMAFMMGRYDGSHPHGKCSVPALTVAGLEAFGPATLAANARPCALAGPLTVEDTGIAHPRVSAENPRVG